MNIYKFEFKMLLKSTLIWASGIGFFVIFYMLFFPLMMVDNDAMLEIMKEFPEEFLAFFGMSSDISFTSLMGYYGLTISFSYIPIAIQASLYGVSILSVEERELTADFLLSKPVSRKEIYISKILAAISSLTIVNITIWISSYLSIWLFNAGDETNYYAATILLLGIIFIQLFFLSVGVLISVIVKKVSSVIAYAMGLGFGMFILSSFGNMLSIDFIKLLTPYNHFYPIDIIVDESFNWPLVTINIIITVFSLVIGYFLYQKRNIKSV